MKRILTTTFLLCAFTLNCNLFSYSFAADINAAPAATKAGATTHELDMSSPSTLPNTLSVHVGDTIKFVYKNNAPGAPMFKDWNCKAKGTNGKSLLLPPNIAIHPAPAIAKAAGSGTLEISYAFGPTGPTQQPIVHKVSVTVLP